MTWLKDSNTHLNKSEQELASKGIYYSFSELAEHDSRLSDFLYILK